MQKHIVPAAQRVGAELLEFARPDVAEVVSGRKKIKTAAKSVGRQILREQLASGSRKKLQAEFFLQNLQNKPVDRDETFLQTFRINHVEHFFWYQSFVAVSGNLGEENPVVDDVSVSHEQETYPSTSLDENCIEFGFQTKRIYYVDLRQPYLALKLNFVKGHGHETHNNTKVKKSPKRRQKWMRKWRQRRSRRFQFLSLLM